MSKAFGLKHCFRNFDSLTVISSVLQLAMIYSEARMKKQLEKIQQARSQDFPDSLPMSPEETGLRQMWGELGVSVMWPSNCGEKNRQMAAKEFKAQHQLAKVTYQRLPSHDVGSQAGICVEDAGFFSIHDEGWAVKVLEAIMSKRPKATRFIFRREFALLLLAMHRLKITLKMFEEFWVAMVNYLKRDALLYLCPFHAEFEKMVKLRKDKFGWKYPRALVLKDQKWTEDGRLHEFASGLVLNQTAMDAGWVD